MSDQDPGHEFTLDRIGPYRLEAKLAKGGMGEIYRGHDERLDRPVALKRISAANAGSERLRERFRREAKMVARLSHPSIVQVFDWLEERGENWLVMELVDGVSLREVASEGSLSMRQLVVCALGIAQGLEAAHRAGIIHRDLKLSNVMLTEEGVKILDFGIAKSLRRTSRDDMATLTEEGVVMGSLSSMSPEQALGQRVDHRSDLFSLGSVIYELLAGRAPFKAKNASETLIRIYSWEHLPVEECNPEVPYRLCRLVDRLLEKEPANRPVDASEVVLELEEVATELGGLSSRIFKVSASSHAAEEATRDLSPAALEATLPNGLPIESTKGEASPSAGLPVEKEGPTASQQSMARRSRRLVAQRPVIGALVTLAIVALVVGWQFLAPRSPPPETVATSQPADAQSPSTGDESAAASTQAEAPRRLAILPFANRTGQSELDAFGLIIADWLTKGLADRVEVIPLEITARAAARDDEVPLSRLGKEIGAAFVISGAFYRSPEELILRAQIHDSEADKVVRSSEALRIPAADVVAGLPLLEDVLGTEVAILFGLPAAVATGSRAGPLDFDEYRAYVERLQATWQSQEERPGTGQKAPAESPTDKE